MAKHRKITSVDIDLSLQQVQFVSGFGEMLGLSIEETLHYLLLRALDDLLRAGVLEPHEAGDD